MKIDRYMNKYGRKVGLFDSCGNKLQEKKCFIQPLRYKNKMYLEGVPTDIGVNDSGYYLLLAPCSMKLDAIGDRGYICDGEKKYHIDRWEKIYLGIGVLYLWAVIKEHTEGSYPYYNHFIERR